MGFNSCYHLTDVVSFVSGRSLAIFDPHCTALPSVTAAEPGKRIDFVATSIVDEFPDQFAPYQVRSSWHTHTSAAMAYLASLWR